MLLQVSFKSKAKALSERHVSEKFKMYVKLNVGKRKLETNKKSASKGCLH